MFVAILLEEPIRAALREVQRRLAPRCSGVRWCTDEQLHLTVKFLGEVDDAAVPPVAEALVAAAGQCGPFVLEVGGTGCFPPDGPVRIVWAGGSVPSGALSRCVQAVEIALEPLGFARERRAFSPHITLGRVKEDPSRGAVRAAVAGATLPAQRQRVDSVALMSSVLSPKGASYSSVCTARFAARPGPGEGEVADEGSHDR